MTQQERQDLIDYYVHTLRGDRAFVEGMDDADLRVAVLIREAEVQDTLDSNVGGGRLSELDTRFFRSNFSVDQQFQEGGGFDSLHDFVLAGSSVAYGVTYVSIILFLAVFALLSVTALFTATKGQEREAAKAKIRTVLIVTFLIAAVPALVMIVVNAFSG